VSLTITEGGYNFDQVTGEFDATAPAVVADARPGAVPTTVFGYVVEALARRRARGVPPFTVMSCDNVQGNGDKARAVFSAFAALRDPGLGEWVRDTVAFPSSMVDRITPVTTDEDRALVREWFGVVDRWPVVAEPFFQWVLEDDFPLGRPPLQDAGVQLVDDVEPYELMKLRLLNVGHQALAYLGWLSGYRYAHEAVADPLLARFVRDYMDEATSTLRPVPGVDLEEYKTTLLERFGNPAVRDTLARLCAETSDRIPKWLVPVVRERLRAGDDVTRAAAIVASWARYAEGTDEQGAPIDVVDRLADTLGERARAQRDGDPLVFLRDPALFGDLVDEPRFTGPYLELLGTLHRAGAQATLTQPLEG